MTPLLYACAEVIALENKKCRKNAPRFVEIYALTICHRQKRILQNERGRTCLQIRASGFIFYSLGLSFDLLKFGNDFRNDFTPFFDFQRPKLSPWAKFKIFCQLFVATSMLNKCANFIETLPAVKKLNSISRAGLKFRRGRTSLYRNPFQANNCGGIFDQLSR